MYSLGCSNWGQATLGDVDYYNSCDTTAVSIGRTFPWVGVPNNYIGHQSAYEGHAYVGINMYVKTSSSYKEYLYVSIPALEVDTEYIISAHVSLADNCNYATDGFGILLTTYGSPNHVTFGTLSYNPQINYASYGVISDSINWTTLTSTFVADSAYKYLIFGGFLLPDGMKIVAVNDTINNPHNNSYYYVDNIEVKKLSATNAPSGVPPIETRIYPNPAHDLLHIDYQATTTEGASIEISDISGRILINNKLATLHNTIDLTPLYPGIYLYQIFEGGCRVMVGKVIRE